MMTDRHETCRGRAHVLEMMIDFGGEKKNRRRLRLIVPDHAMMNLYVLVQTGQNSRVRKMRVRMMNGQYNVNRLH